MSADRSPGENAVPDAYSIVRQAILDKEQVVATYQGHRRELCPHVLGTKNGRRQALFFQFGGASASGLAPGGAWRCMPIDGLSDVTSRSGRWHTGPREQPQTCVDDVDVEVAQ
jgi:hypothetical protein